MIEFDYKLNYKKLDFTDKKVRKLYRIGRGEQGVLLVRPYTNDICKYWRFKTLKEAEVSSQKVQVVLQSKIADQYCLGVAKLQKKDYTELKKIQERFQTGTVWKFDTIKLVNEEPSFVHTACRITVDLRQSQARAMLQSTSFPEVPVPTCTIADILKLKQMQR